MRTGGSSRDIACLAVARRRFAIAILMILVVAGGLYYSQIQPGGMRAPSVAVMARLEREAERPVFAYGTLTSPLVRFVVTLGVQDPRPASLEGYRRVGRNILPDESGVVEGVLFEVTPGELRRLDLYERVGTRYERVLVDLANGSTAWAYRMVE